MGKKSKSKDVETPGDARAPEPSWHAMPTEDVVRYLKCTEDVLTKGLTSQEAEQRLADFGYNQLTEKEKKTIWQRIWDQVANVLVAILLVVALVSAIQGIGAIIQKQSDKIVTNWIQVGLIMSVITLNTWIGIMQEGSAEKAADALKGMLSADARVLRDGQEKMIPATEVVPGDVVLLGTGDRVPADLRMVQVMHLANLEAALTGESVPIDKVTETIPVPTGGNPEQTPLGDRHNMAFSATLVAQGAGKGLAIATGDHTQIGTINSLVQSTEKKKTAVLEQIDQVSKLIAVFILLSTTATFLVAFLKTKMEPLEAITTALTCAVGMIPEGLEAIVTLVYAWAVSNMAKQNAIIRALPAVETLGSVTVICSDKTGTLTKNEMSLTAFVTSNARYKNNLHAKDRVPSNFTRDDSFLGERSAFSLKQNPHLRGKKVARRTEYDITHDVVQNGASPSIDYINAALACGVLCSKCVIGKNGSKEGDIGNPTELSILRAAYFAGIDIDRLKRECPIVAEVPFNSEYKFMSTVHEPIHSVDGNLRDEYVVYAKGAPDRMVKLCKYQAKGGVIDPDTYEPIEAEYWQDQISILSSHGLRVLALCRATIPKSQVTPDEQLGPEFVNGKGEWMTLIGLCAIMDPPRPECVQAIKEAHGAGVRVAMITGDHKDTATAIGHMLGIVDEKYGDALTGPELDNMSDMQLRKAVMTHNVFARASPENKIQIVKALQAEQQVSSMTGDGVNDAPALKAADMGVAMGKEGTDVAREAAEMILADDNFATIVTAVREGRVVWDNLRKVLLVNTPINNAQGLSVLFGLVFGMEFVPLTPIQILYSNLICAVTLGFVCAIEPAEEGIMAVPPRRVGKRLIGRYLLLRIILGTVILVAVTIGSQLYSAHLGYDMYAQRSQAFNTLDLGAIGVTLSARFSYNSSIHPRIFKGNIAAWYSIAIVVALQIAITYIPGLNRVIFSMGPMSGIQWAISIVCMFIVFFIMEFEKMIRRCLKSRGADTDDRELTKYDKYYLSEDLKGNQQGPLVSADAGIASLRSVELNR